MPRPKSPPRYEFHKPTGQAYTRIGGKCIYLGKHGSAESHAKFSCLLSQWELTGEGTLNITDGGVVSSSLDYFVVKTSLA